jgi:hypothetical protein
LLVALQKISVRMVRIIQARIPDAAGEHQQHMQDYMKLVRLIYTIRLRVEIKVINYNMPILQNLVLV